MPKKNSFISGLICKMDLDQKVGALLTLGFAGTVARSHIYENILKYRCGGLRLTPHSRLFGSYVDPKTGKSVVNVVDSKGYKKGVPPPYLTAGQYRDVLQELQEKAMSRPLSIPLHFSYDQEGGTSADFNFGGVNLFPKPMGIRATGDSGLAYEVAKAVGRQGRAVGFNWIHSPVLDVIANPENSEISTRAYSDDAGVVAEYALKSCIGFKEAGLIATGKHFPGRGDTAVDAHFATPVIDVSRDLLMKRDLLPYRVLIENDVLPSIMIAHSIFPAIDPDEISTVSKKVLTGLLRDEMGFDGVITTDSMTMGAIADRYGVANACAMALEAGADLVLMKAESKLVEETIETIKSFVTSGRIPADELDKKLERVLGVKYEYGLFANGSLWDEMPEEAINDKRIIELSNTVARRSIYNLKGDVLPLSKDEPALIVEQISKTPNMPNNYYWHAGMLYENSCKYNPNLSYLETAFRYDEDDIAAIEGNIDRFETVIITNFHHREKLANTEYLTGLIDKYPGKKIILVTNTPYPISIPKNAENVLITFATTPASIAATAGVLFGEITPEAEYPISFRM